MPIGLESKIAVDEIAGQISKLLLQLSEAQGIGTASVNHFGEGGGIKVIKFMLEGDLADWAAGIVGQTIDIGEEWQVKIEYLMPQIEEQRWSQARPTLERESSLAHWENRVNQGHTNQLQAILAVNPYLPRDMIALKRIAMAHALYQDHSDDCLQIGYELHECDSVFSIVEAKIQHGIQITPKIVQVSQQLRTLSAIIGE